MADVEIPARLICPTTGHAFRPHTYRVQHINQHTFLWVWCPCCDSSHRPTAHPHFDAASPQIHCVELCAANLPPLRERAVGE